MSQPARMSLVEMLTDTVAGICITGLLNLFYLGLPLERAVQAVGVYTLASMCRRFATRRLFNALGRS